jgi:hypothetical protein
MLKFSVQNAANANAGPRPAKITGDEQKPIKAAIPELSTNIDKVCAFVSFVFPN